MVVVLQETAEIRVQKKYIYIYLYIIKYMFFCSFFFNIFSVSPFFASSLEMVSSKGYERNVPERDMKCPLCTAAVR